MSDLASLLRALSQDESGTVTAVTDEMIAKAQREGVVTLLHDLQSKERSLVLPSCTARLLHNIAKQETAVELAKMMGVRQVLGCMASAEISVLLLKGGALAYWLYASPAQRARCDLDILVANIQVAKQAIIALKQAGYIFRIEAAEDSAEFEVTLEHTSRGGFLHRVDLHWRVLNHARLAAGLDFADLEARAIDIPSLQCGARGLGLVHALLHALLHRVTNIPSGQQDRLIWLYDIHLLAKRCSGEEWVEFVRQCSSLACATPCLDGLIATRSIFATPIPTPVEDALEDQTQQESWRLGSQLDHGAMDRAHLAALAWPQKLGWLRRKLFPSRHFMRFRYQVSGVTGLTKAYFRRWWIGLQRALGRVN